MAHETTTLFAQSKSNRLPVRLLMRGTQIIAIVGFLLFAAQPSHASVVSLYLDNVQFDSGATASGSFDFDTTTYAVSNVNISTTADVYIPANNYNTGIYIDASHSAPYYIQLGPFPGNSSFVFTGTLSGAAFPVRLYLSFPSSELPLSSNTITLDGTYSLIDWQSDADNTYDPTNGDHNGGEYLVSGEIDATPLPATLPLFVSGLGVIGLLTWRRKRKAAALLIN